MPKHHATHSIEYLINFLKFQKIWKIILELSLSTKKLQFLYVDSCEALNESNKMIVNTWYADVGDDICEVPKNLSDNLI